MSPAESVGGRGGEAEYLRPAAMAKALGVSRVTLYRLSQRPGFPGVVHLSSRHTLFPRAATLAWMAANVQPHVPKPASCYRQPGEGRRQRYNFDTTGDEPGFDAEAEALVGYQRGAE